MRHSGPAESNERGATTPAPSHFPSASTRASAALSSVKLRLLSARPRHISPDWLPIAAIVLSLAYYYTVPSPLLSLPGLLAFIALAWLRLDLALCLLPLTFPFWFVPKRVGGSVVFPLSEIALGVCFAVALARGVVPALERVRTHGLPPFRISRGLSARESPLDKQPLERKPGTGRQSDAPTDVRRALYDALSRLQRAGMPILIGAALLLLGTALGVLVARRPHEALRAFRWEVAEPLLYAALVLLYLRRQHVRLLVGAFLGAALLLAALAALQVFWMHVTFLPVAQANRLIPYVTSSGAIPRATAFIFGSGNTLGAWMARTLPLALALALAPRGLPRRWRALAAVVALACVPALLWSDSRGALIAAVLACAVVSVLSLPRPRWAVGVSIAGALVALVALVVLLANRAAVLNALLTGHNGSGEVRTLVWLAAWHMIRDHLLLGIGPDQFLYYYSNLYTTHPYWILYQNGHRTLAWTEPNLAQPHNLILDLWLSGGILALVGFILVLAAFWLGCWRVWRAARISVSPRPRGEGLGVKSIPPTFRRPMSTGLQPTSRAPAIDGRDPSASPLLVGAARGGASDDVGAERAESGAVGPGVRFCAAIALGLGASVLAGVLHGMVDSAYFEPDLALLFWWSVAVLLLLVV